MAIWVREQDSIKRRIERLFWILTAFYLALICRLVWLQVLNGDFYSKQAAFERARKFPQSGQRGAILDREGRPLALTVHSNVLVCDPSKVVDPQATADIIVRMFGGDRNLILAAVSPGQLTKRGRPDRCTVVPVELSENASETLDRFRNTNAKDSAFWSKLVPKSALLGIDLADRTKRIYPAGDEAVHVVGLSRPAAPNQPEGMLGLELSQDAFLRGTNGFVRAEADPKGRVIPFTAVERQDAADGADLRLTLDSTIQHIAETELQKCIDERHPRGAAVIVMDPRTGEIYAMVSSPSFDPLHREILKTDLEPLRNRALDPFEPGSTLKIITAAAALEKGLVTKTETFYCNGSWQQGSKTIRCASHGGSSAHGRETIREVIANSCNVAAGQIGVRVTTEGLKEYLHRFGLLESTGVGLPGDKSGFIGHETGQIKAARVGFGQAVTINPLGLAAAYSAIANNGVLMKPRLIASLQDSNGKTLRQFGPERVRQAIKPETAAYLRTLLEAVVTSGTGKGKAEVPGYIVAGKTGTAQKVVKGEHGYSRDKYVASFIGFLPARNPKALIYVIVDEPQGTHFGSQVAAPVFAGIGQRLMWHWNVPPDDPSAADRSRVASATKPDRAE